MMAVDIFLWLEGCPSENELAVCALPGCLHHPSYEHLSQGPCLLKETSLKPSLDFSPWTVEKLYSPISTLAPPPSQTSPKKVVFRNFESQHLGYQKILLYLSWGFRCSV